eukprot:333314-Hanusia_phi.AAC.1
MRREAAADELVRGGEVEEDVLLQLDLILPQQPPLHRLHGRRAGRIPTAARQHACLLEGRGDALGGLEKEEGGVEEEERDGGDAAVAREEERLLASELLGEGLLGEAGPGDLHEEAPGGRER